MELRMSKRDGKRPFDGEFLQFIFGETMRISGKMIAAASLLVLCLLLAAKANVPAKVKRVGEPAPLRVSFRVERYEHDLIYLKPIYPVKVVGVIGNQVKPVEGEMVTCYVTEVPVVQHVHNLRLNCLNDLRLNVLGLEF